MESPVPTTPMTIARPSLASLLILLFGNGRLLASATGFVVERNGASYLITNRHCLAGRDRDNQPSDLTGAVPDTVVIHHNTHNMGEWRETREPVVDNSGLPMWFEHPHHGRRVDVVALPLTNLDGVKLYQHDVAASAPRLAASVARDVSIIGFPFGMTAGGVLGVWSRGSIASEPAVDYDDLPLFLVDSRTRPGQSGSPVIVYASGGMVPLENGSTAILSGPAERLLGVYSGRINDQSDLGFVWKTHVIPEIIDGASRRPAFP